MPMTLSDHQAAFSADVMRLLMYGNARRDQRLRLGEVERDPRVSELNAKSGAGISNSLHNDSLAVDMRLDQSIAGGPWIWQKDTTSYKELGDYWKSLDKANRWGGDFHERPDGNHFSRSPDGVRA